jgi:hypothetical protein
LVQVSFWDVRIVGWLLNRFILESSAGYALFIGYALQVHRSQIKSFLQQIKTARFQISRASLTMASLILFLAGSLYTVRSYIYPNFLRDYETTHHISYVFRDALHHLVNTVPPNAHLIVNETLIEGIEHASQLDDALYIFDRSDIQRLYYSDPDFVQALNKLPPNTAYFFVLSRTPPPIDQIPDRHTLTDTYHINYGRYAGAVYHFKLNRSNTESGK